MTAPLNKSKSPTRVHYETTPADQAPRNTPWLIYVAFTTEGPFVLTFKPYRSSNDPTKDEWVTSRRFPILPLSTLRTQLVVVHDEFWQTAKLPVNPDWVHDGAVIVGDSQATSRQAYVYRLQQLFNKTCENRGTHATMILGTGPEADTEDAEA